MPSPRATVQPVRSRAGNVALALSLLTALYGGPSAPAVQATSGVSPYDVPQAIDHNPDPNVFETNLVATEAMVDIGGGVMAHAQTFNGSIPGPEFRLSVGQRVIVHFKNELHHEETGIHWHGIELANAYDGTPLTQNQVAPGDSFLYDFVVSRPGVFWYHPHHHHSTNQVFKGMYGSIIVRDPNEAPLINGGWLPPGTDTHTLVLSDTTVCKAPGTNDDPTYDLSLPWAGGSQLPAQPGQRPKQLCETPIDHDGNVLKQPLAAGEIPNIQGKVGVRVNEGQTVLTNGMNVGGRTGTPLAPGALAPDASVVAVRRGHGLRLQLVNAATTRFFRLRLSASDGSLIPLVRVGGQGGLLDTALIEGTRPGEHEFDFKYEMGEILLDPGDRQDVVAAIPATASGVATLWTLDFPRTGLPPLYSAIPTVPVAHFGIVGQAPTPAYSINDGAALRARTGDPIEVLGPPTVELLDPTAFSPPKPGMADPVLKFTTAGGGPGINGIQAHHDFSIDYFEQIAPASARYAKLGGILEMAIHNTTAAHHPFHLHGFSIQPRTMSNCPGPVSAFNFPRMEFVDNINIPAGCALSFRLRLEDRPMVDGTTPGGGLGRWMFHCHIFFHHHHGMASEVIVTDANGNERPYVDADDPRVLANEGSTALMGGVVFDPDGDPVTMSASAGSVVDNGDGSWSWSYVPPDGPASHQVFITATDSHGNTGQTAFLLDVENVPPRLVLDPDATIDEGVLLALAAGFTDQGSDMPYRATIDFGEGSGPQSAQVEVTQGGPPQSGTISGEWQYGDNGSFNVVVSVSDKDGASTSDSFVLTVVNVDPDATIQTSGPAVVVAGEPITLEGSVTDPGSDDITSIWAFGDGTPEDVQLSLVNPPLDDGPQSPTVQPRAVGHQTVHTYAQPCAYLATFSAYDDDGGADRDSLAVVVTAASALSRGAGYWHNQAKGKGKTDLTPAELQCYLAIATTMSAVFDEARPSGTIGEAVEVLKPGSGGSPTALLDRELLAAWLNFANGAFRLDDLVDTDGDGIAETTFSDAMAEAEAVRLDAAATKDQLLTQSEKLEHVNARDGQ